MNILSESVQRSLDWKRNGPLIENRSTKGKECMKIEKILYQFLQKQQQSTVNCYNFLFFRQEYNMRGEKNA